ncbi:MAG: hypothetical protein RUDDFDWM_000573 [Candidatus Fervidibacterota bacterium]
MKQGALLIRLLFVLSFLLVAADVKFAMFGIPTVVVSLFLAYVISWEMAHLFKVKLRAFSSEAFATSISTAIVGVFFYLGRTDKAVAALIHTKGQNAAYRSTPWMLNDLTLIALSIGIMMGILVIAATIVSYAADVWHHRKLQPLLFGVTSSVLIGTLIGVVFGLMNLLGAPDGKPELLFSIIIGLGIASYSCLVNETSEECRKKAMVHAVQMLVGATLSAIIVWVLSANVRGMIEAFVLIIIGAVMQRYLSFALAGTSVPIPKEAPKLMVGWIGFYTGYFLPFGVCVLLASLIEYAIALG